MEVRAYEKNGSTFDYRNDRSIIFYDVDLYDILDGCEWNRDSYGRYTIGNASAFVDLCCERTN